MTVVVRSDGDALEHDAESTRLWPPEVDELEPALRFAATHARATAELLFDPREGVEYWLMGLLKICEVISCQLPISERYAHYLETFFADEEDFLIEDVTAMRQMLERDKLDAHELRMALYRELKRYGGSEHRRVDMALEAAEERAWERGRVIREGQDMLIFLLHFPTPVTRRALEAVRASSREN